MGGQRQAPVEPKGPTGKPVTPRTGQPAQGSGLSGTIPDDIKGLSAAITGLAKTVGSLGVQTAAASTVITKQLQLTGIQGTGVAGRMKGTMKGFGSDIKEGLKKFPGGIVDTQVDDLGLTSDALQKVSEALGYVKMNFDGYVKGIKESGVPLGALNIKTAKATEDFGKMAAQSLYLRNALREGGEENSKMAGTVAALGAQYIKTGGNADDFAKIVETVGTQFAEAQGGPKNFTKALTKTLNVGRGLSAMYGMPLPKAIEFVGSKFKGLTVMGMKPLLKNMAQLHAMSNKLKIGMGDLAAIGGKFDSYPEAAQSIGELSAVLDGTSLSAAEMVAAEPAERIRKVLSEIQQSVAEGRSNIAESGQQRVYDLQALAQASGASKEALDKFLRGQIDVNEVISGATDVAEKTGAQYGKMQLAAAGHADRVGSGMAMIGNKATLNAEAMKGFDNAGRRAIERLSKKLASSKILDKFATLSSTIGVMQERLETMAKKGGKEGLVGNILFGQTDVLTKVIDIGRATADITRDVITEAKGITEALTKAAAALKNIKLKTDAGGGGTGGGQGGVPKPPGAPGPTHPMDTTGGATTGGGTTSGGSGAGGGTALWTVTSEGLKFTMPPIPLDALKKAVTAAWEQK